MCKGVLIEFYLLTEFTFWYFTDLLLCPPLDLMEPNCYWKIYVVFFVVNTYSFNNTTYRHFNFLKTGRLFGTIRLLFCLVPHFLLRRFLYRLFLDHKFCIFFKIFETFLCLLKIFHPFSRFVCEIVSSICLRIIRILFYLV